MADVPHPRRGEVWDIDLGDPLGHEQGGRRPALVVSVDTLNRSAAGIVVVCPLTTTDRRIPSHVRVEPDEGGLDRTSFVKTEDVRSISLTRFLGPRGAVEPGTMRDVNQKLRILLGLA